MSRVRWLDTAKGLGIILVVLGHACIPNLVNNNEYIRNIFLSIYLFHMPLFMYLSGYAYYYFTSKVSFKDFFVKKIKTLIIPYFIYMCLVYIFIILLNIISRTYINGLVQINIHITLLDIIKDIILCIGMIDKHVWYIYVLFIMYIIVYFVSDKRKCFIFFLIISVLLSPIVINNEDLWVGFNVFYYFPFFALGKLDLNLYIKKRSKIFKIIFLIVYVIINLLYINKLNILKSLGILFIYIKMLLALMGIISFIIIITIIETKKLDVINFLGKKSFYIYLIHQPFIVSGSTYVIYRITSNSILAIIISTLIGIVIPIGYVLIKKELKKRYARKSY